MVTLWDVSSYVYADYVEKLGIKYIDSIEGITEKIQMKANRISHVFTVHMRIFYVSEQEPLSSHPCITFFLWPCVQ